MRCVRRCGGGLIWRALAALVAAAGAWPPAPPARADESILTGDASQPSRFELWSGAQAYDRVWSLYSGTTVAPFGAIHDDGVRLRLVAGYGADRYSGPRSVGNGSQIFTFKGAGSFADVLVGYQQRLGSLTVKAFAGVSAADRQVTPDDPESVIHGAGFGGKLALETWWNLGDQAWTSVDVSWGSLYQSYAARARLGWRLTPALSAGLEAGAAGNLEGDVVRAGVFARYEWASGEVSISGGASNDGLLDGIGPSLARSSTPFVTFSWLTRF